MQCNLIDSFMEKLGLARAALVGHGLGAVVALKFAAQRPESVDRIMAVGAPLDGRSISTRLRSSTPAELADWLLSRDPAMNAARLEAPRADALAILTTLDDLQSMNLNELLANLQTPCLFVQGQNDPTTLAPRMEDLAFLPESTHHILFEGSGHFPMLDETNKFNRLLVDFLSLNSGESPKQLQLKDEWKRRVR
jgi:pimeloyl-ACP methyl ester carboxylesterase